MRSEVLLILLTAACYLNSASADSKLKNVYFASAEHEPYIGQQLPNQGYAAELATLAFKRSGYQVIIRFYPLARAKLHAHHGLVDGLLPTPMDSSLADEFTFSDAFPGNNIGFLKLKSHTINSSLKDELLVDRLIRLKRYKFGLVRGFSVNPIFDKAAFLQKQRVTDDLQNIEKLEKGRIDFAVIDKFTASSLLVNQRPDLIGKVDFLDMELDSSPFHIAFSKSNPAYPALLTAFNDGLQSLKNDGTLKKVLMKHGLFSKKTSNSSTTVTLNIATVNNQEMLILKKLSKQFELENPLIKLEWKIMSENILRKKLLSDLAIFDVQFDVMTIGAYETPIWAKKGWLTKIDDLDDFYDKDDILAPVKSSLSYNNEIYALPFYAESSVTFYRKDLFSKSNIKMPAKPSFNEIKQFAHTLHDPENEVYGICLRGKPGWGENVLSISTMVNTYGGQWFDMNWLPQIASKEWKAAITMYKDLLKSYGPTNSPYNGYKENLNLFKNGHCAMWIDATVAAGSLYNPNTSIVHADVGMTLAPTAITPKGASTFWVWALAIPESSNHKKEAKQFITWATSKDYIQLVADVEGWEAIPPGTRSSTYENIYYRTAAPFSEEVFKSINQVDLSDSTLAPSPYQGIQYVSIPEFPALGWKVGTLMQKVLKDELTIDKALEESQNFALDLMTKSGYYKKLKQ